MISKIEKLNPGSLRMRTVFSCVMLVLILAQTFSFAIHNKMHQRIPESLDHYAEAISIAISHANYGLQGYTGYRNIYDTIIANGFDWDHHEDPITLNGAIQKARETKAGTEQILFSVGDVGFVDYTRFAFTIFGYNIESLLYFFFLILLVQVVMFFIQFRSNNLSVTGLILFLLGHYIVVTGLYTAGYNLWAVHNNRFLSVLGILPIAHLCLLALFGKQIKFSTVLGAVVQILIFVFVLRCRNSAQWMVAPLLLIGAAAMIAWIRNKINVKIQLWPILLALGVILFAGFMKPHVLNTAYYSEKNLANHTFWFPVYVGLATDPDIRAIYGPRPDLIYDEKKYLSVLCEEDHSDDGRYKAKARQWLCAHSNMARPFLEVLNSWRGCRLDYTQNDQDGARAVLKWIRANGKTEEHLYTFGPQDRVGYPRWFGQCDSIEKELQNQAVNKTLRPFDSKRDFKWREMDHIMGLVVKDAVTHHPLLVLKVVVLTKPFFFLLYFFMYFFKLKSLWGILLCIITYGYLRWLTKESRDDQKRMLLVFMYTMFALSMIVTLTAYPAPHTISDQAVLLTTSILGTILFLRRRTKGKVAR